MEKEQLKKIEPAKVRLLPPRLDYASLMKELIAAHAAVGELRGLLSTLPDQKILIAPFRKREAVASSAIEGTRATLEEVLDYEAVNEAKDINEEKKDTEEDDLNRKVQDIWEVMNYEDAMNIALKELDQRPIGENLLKKTHYHLLDSVRGENKDRGNFRREQVRVGDYIPPMHTDIKALIHNWENYLNAPDMEEDPLIRAGVAHYQFEAIHPFMDGNGRIGRLIIPLFLCQERILQSPVLYISHHLEKYKVEYQRLLHGIDTKQEWIPWLKFFLLAVQQQAAITAEITRQIQFLYEELKAKVAVEIRSQHAVMMLDAIFSKPISSSKYLRASIKAKNKGTTYNLLKKFVKAGILKERKNYRSRTKVYVFTALLKIIKV